MELLQILLVLNLIAISVVIIILIKKNKVSVNNIYTGLENLVDDEYFSKAVKEYYLDVIKNPNLFTISSCTMNKLDPDLDIMIWTANSIDSRRFYTHSNELKNKVNELNSKLTHFDRVLLDKIALSIKDRNKKIEEKIFF